MADRIRGGRSPPMRSESQFASATFAERLLADRDDTEQSDNLPLGQHRRLVIAFVGMAFEAKIAAGPGVLVFSRDSRRELLAAVEHSARQGYCGIISFGVAGGLVSGLRPGDWVVASAIVEPDATRATDAAWSRKLCDAIPGASYAPILGVDAPVGEPTTKRELHRATGAVAVDMESHLVARLAAAHGLACTALRVIVDPADRPIPPAALLGMGAGARAECAAVIRDVIARPAQLPGLLRLSLDALIAGSEMLRVRRLLGPHFGLGALGHGELLQPSEPNSDPVQSGITPYRAPA